MLHLKASNGKVTSGFLSTLLETAAVAMLFAAWSVSHNVLSVTTGYRDNTESHVLPICQSITEAEWDEPIYMEEYNSGYKY